VLVSTKKKSTLRGSQFASTLTQDVAKDMLLLTWWNPSTRYMHAGYLVGWKWTADLCMSRCLRPVEVLEQGLMPGEETILER